jgi:hypothetical protein
MVPWLQHPTLGKDALADRDHLHSANKVFARRRRLRVAVAKLQVGSGTARDPQSTAEHWLAEVSKSEPVGRLDFAAALVDESYAHLPLAMVLDPDIRGQPQLHVGRAQHILLSKSRV